MRGKTLGNCSITIFSLKDEENSNKFALRLLPLSRGMTGIIAFDMMAFFDIHLALW
jgi:hypothetical protein